jgi:hypothetical protein
VEDGSHSIGELSFEMAEEADDELSGVTNERVVPLEAG